MREAPDLLEFESFFESEPKNVSADGWICGAEFTYIRGEDRIDATLVAVDGELSLKWWQADRLRADVRLAGIVDWAIDSDSSNETLRVKFQYPNVVFFVIQTKPYVSLSWAVQCG